MMHLSVYLPLDPAVEVEGEGLRDLVLSLCSHEDYRRHIKSTYTALSWHVYD